MPLVTFELLGSPRITRDGQPLDLRVRKEVRTSERASALNAAAALLWASGDADAALLLLDEALAIGREIGDLWNTGWVLLHQGTIAYRQGDHTSARPLLEDGLANCRAAGPAGQRGVGWGADLSG